MNSLKIFLLSLSLFFGLFLSTIAWANCPVTMADKTAIDIASNAMNTWFTAVQKNDLPTLSKLFAPQFVLLHSVGAPLTKSEELKLLTGWQLGGYRFSDFCAMQMNDTIIATFASKTYGKDISKTDVNFLSKSKAYRMLVMQKIDGKWLIIAYANTNPIT